MVHVTFSDRKSGLYSKDSQRYYVRCKFFEFQIIKSLVIFYVPLDFSQISLSLLKDVYHESFGKISLFCSH